MSLFPLSSKQSFLCLHCKIRADSSKYLCLVSWHDTKLCQQRVLKEEGLLFSGSGVLSSAGPCSVNGFSSTWLLHHQSGLQRLALSHNGQQHLPSTFEGEFPAGVAEWVSTQTIPGDFSATLRAMHVSPPESGSQSWVGVVGSLDTLSQPQGQWTLLISVIYCCFFGCVFLGFFLAFSLFFTRQSLITPILL